MNAFFNNRIMASLLFNNIIQKSWYVIINNWNLIYYKNELVKIS